MVNVLIFSAEPRLIEAVRSNLTAHAEVSVSSDAQHAQQLLVQTPTRLAFFDYELIRKAPDDAMVRIDSALRLEQAIGVLLCRSATPDAVEFRDRFSSLRVAIDLSRGREQFDTTVKRAFSAVYKADDPSVSTDRLLRHEVDLPVPDSGTLGEFPLARLLYTIWQRRESGLLKLRYATRQLEFGFHNGELGTSQYDPANELLGAFSWSHGHYDFAPSSEIPGWRGDPKTRPILPLIAAGCREHTRQRSITETMTPIMRRYPVPTNLWAERAQDLADDLVLTEVMAALDGETTWETALSALGQRVTEGFRAAYLALQLDLVHTVEQSGLVGVAILYSRSVRKAREAVEQAEVEQTKAYKASTGTGRSEVERELGVFLGKLRTSTPHEIFGVWEGCGRKVVRDRFYELVKEHHPDAYGGNTSGNVRALSQEIFIRIKEAYQALLSVEDAQTVAPTVEKTRTATPAPTRARIDTPRISSEVGAQLSEPSNEPVDVKAKLAQMSSFRKKQRHRERVTSLRERTNSGIEEVSSAEHERTETPVAEQISEPEVDAGTDRKSKIKHLLQRAHDAGHPDADPARDAWHKGFELHKAGQHREALKHFEAAHDMKPGDPLFTTFYAYGRFLVDPTTAAEVEKQLRGTLTSGNRQTAPDTCLFLAHTIKAQGREEEALTFYKKTLRLNPASRDAEREVRLAEKRNPRKGSDPGSIIKNLFKKSST